MKWREGYVLCLPWLNPNEAAGNEAIDWLEAASQWREGKSVGYHWSREAVMMGNQRLLMRDLRKAVWWNAFSGSILLVEDAPVEKLAELESMLIYWR